MKAKLLGCIGMLFCLPAFSQSDLLETRSVVPEPCMDPFYHGVASGDPMKDRVIIWTRVTPTDENQNPVVVGWKVATDTAMTNIVQSGSLITTYERDYTVKIDVTGLQADQWYYYEFYAYGKRSIQGRTRTTPLPDAYKDSLRFAVVSCANFEAGYFNVYASLADRKDIDAVLCLGDYYYEYATGGYSPNPAAGRVVEPLHEIVTLDDYRMRHSIYRLDKDLRRLHQLFPWFCIWDDHESANDSWMGGAENHNTGEGDWIARKEASKKAYFEWLPIRDNDLEGQYEIYRTASYGVLADIILLDTRLTGRSQQVSWGSSQLNNSNRSMLGTAQKDWFLNELSTSTAIYKLVAQQVMMAPLTAFGIPVNMDQWDGYPTERSQILNHVFYNGIQNFVVLTGDIHTAWAMEIPIGASRAGVEFVTPSVTSPGMDLGSGVGESVIMAANSHIKWCNLNKKGYMIVDVNQNRVQSDWYFVNTIDASDATAVWAKSYYANQGSTQLQATNTIAFARPDIFSDVPQHCPRVVEEEEEPEEPEEPGLALEEIQKDIIVIGMYPNPVSTILNIHFSNLETDEMTMEILDETGRNVFKETFICQQGSWIKQINTTDFLTGKYTLFIHDEGNPVLKRNFVKY